MKFKRHCIISLFYFVFFISSAMADTDSFAKDSAIAQMIVEGARKEIANETEYNTTMLSRYFGTHYRDGIRYEHNVYPNGDVNPKEGVCTDLVIRALRKAGYDLQKIVHEDIVENKEHYGIETVDKYIDHRRVWVLLKYFNRNYTKLKMDTDDSCKNWRAGDIVIWDIGSRDHFHIGIISDKRSEDGLRPLVIHNMSYFPGVFTGKTNEQDVLNGVKISGVDIYQWKILGHFRITE
ncbi:MAG: DUF1287 domain-containing protein, partial [bacterium]